MIDADLQRDAEDVLRRIAAARAGGPTFGALMDAFVRAAEATGTSSAKTYRSKSKPLKLHFGDLPAAGISKAWAKEYRTRRMNGDLGGKAGAFTAELELSLARQVLNGAVDDGTIQFNPLARLKKKRCKTTPQGALREEHLPAVVGAAPNLATAIYIVVAFDTGCRRTEALSLRWDDVDYEAVTITVRHGKGDKFRVVVTTTRVLEAIRRIPRVLGSPFIFANPRSKRRRHYCSETMNDWVREAVLKANVERFYAGRKVRIHGLRRGHATNAVERGVDIRSVQDQLGHASISTTEKYLDGRIAHRVREMRSKFDRNLTDPLAPRKGPQRANEDTSGHARIEESLKTS